MKTLPDERSLRGTGPAAADSCCYPGRRVTWGETIYGALGLLGPAKAAASALQAAGGVVAPVFGAPDFVGLVGPAKAAASARQAAAALRPPLLAASDLMALAESEGDGDADAEAPAPAV